MRVLVGEMLKLYFILLLIRHFVKQREKITYQDQQTKKKYELGKIQIFIDLKEHVLLLQELILVECIFPFSLEGVPNFLPHSIC